MACLDGLDLPKPLDLVVHHLIILCETYSLVLGLMHQDRFQSSQNEEEDDATIMMQKMVPDELPRPASVAHT